jgi:dTDP-glucose 4,6-dehydratase
LVTGAGGFVGSHLCEALVKENYDVRAFVRYNSQNLWGWLEESPLRNEIEVFPGDVRDYDSVCKAVEGVHRVYHLAALIAIPYSYQVQQAYVDVNITGTLHLLQASLEAGVEKFIQTSTSEVYGTAQYVPIDEKHPINPQSPYAATKASADYLALSFYKSFDLPITILRPFNTYGPRQSARAIIPTIITQLLEGRSEIKLGNVHPTRDLTYVKDTARGFIEIATCPQCIGEITNLGMGTEISVGDLAELIASLMNKKIRVVTDVQRIRPQRSEVERLLASNTKIVSETQWRPQYNLEKGLSETITWLSEHRNMYKTGIYNV